MSLENESEDEQSGKSEISDENEESLKFSSKFIINSILKIKSKQLEKLKNEKTKTTHQKMKKNNQYKFEKV